MIIIVSTHSLFIHSFVHEHTLITIMQVLAYCAFLAANSENKVVKMWIDSDGISI